MSTVELAAGYEHACALKKDGKVYCFGKNRLGQVGNASYHPFDKEVLVKDLPPAEHISAGDMTTCAATKDGRLFCWGSNLHGELARETPKCPGPTQGSYESLAKPGPCSAKPVEMPYKSVSLISVGRGFVCVATKGEDGEVACWGDNEFGQLGLPKTTYGAPRPSPMKIALKGSGAIVELVNVGLGACARQASGDVTCWGDVGTVTCAPDRKTPEPRTVGAFRDADELAGGGAMTCARHGATVTCCGHSISYEVQTGPDVRSTSTRTRDLAPMVSKALAGAEELHRTFWAVCGRVGSAWTCEPATSHEEYPEWTKTKYAKLAPASDAEIARLVLFEPNWYVRDDDAIFGTRPKVMTSYDELYRVKGP